MPDNDRVKGEVNHPEGTVEEGVGTLKDDAKVKTQGAADTAKSKVGSTPDGKNSVPDSTHTGTGDPRSQK